MFQVLERVLHVDQSSQESNIVLFVWVSAVDPKRTGMLDVMSWIGAIWGLNMSTKSWNSGSDGGLEENES